MTDQTSETLELDYTHAGHTSDVSTESVSPDATFPDQKIVTGTEEAPRRRRRRRRNSERTPEQTRRLEIRRQEIGGRRWLLTEFDLHWFLLGHETMESASLTLPGGVTYENVTPLTVEDAGERVVLRGGRFTARTVEVLRQAVQRFAAEGAGLESGDVLYDRNGWPRFRVTDDREVVLVEYPN